MLLTLFLNILLQYSSRLLTFALLFLQISVANNANIVVSLVHGEINTMSKCMTLDAHTKKISYCNFLVFIVLLKSCFFEIGLVKLYLMQPCAKAGKTVSVTNSARYAIILVYSDNNMHFKCF